MTWAAGVDRRAAEAHAEALNDAIARRIFPDLATKADLSATEHRLMMAIEQATHQQSIRVFGMVFAIVELLDAILFALLRIVR
jgi:hypothetical protein